MEGEIDMDIAVTAIAGVFPGAADVDRYWDNILNARVAGLAPIDRYWNIPKENYYDPRMDIPNKAYLNDYFPLEECFDSFKEIEDRQVRIGVSVVDRLFKDLTQKGSMPDIGRMALSCGTAWSAQSYFSEDEENFFRILLGQELKCHNKEIYSADGQIQKIADLMGIGGPRISVETACASSLYALDAAAALLETGQADSAVVLGLNAYLFPFLFFGFSKLKALSASGKCLPFSVDASGVVFGEAVGAILIEPLERAVQEGRQILGVIRSIGLSSDGAERSPFAPGQEGQLLSLKRAYRDLNPEEVDYIEAHGTATKLGDETELKVLDRFFGEYCRDKKIPVGSVKSIIGHTLAAAAMSSLIKCILILNKKIIPPHIKVEPIPALKDSCLYLPKEPVHFKQQGRPMRIGISSFGFGGTNSHAVLESYEGVRKKKKQFKFEPVAIIDMEAAFGHAIGGGNVKELLDSKERVYSEFPWRRFDISDMSQVKEFSDTKGLFFPDSATIEAKGLRIGPNSLKRIDPFQLLANDLTYKLLDRNKGVKDSADTAVTFCNNFGGAMPMHVSRMYALLLKKGELGIDMNDPKMSELLKWEMSSEELVSSLTVMFSGYPSSSFNLRAMHQTISGGAGIFWTSLACAPYWLSRHCKSLLIGAGHLIKSPADISMITGGKNPVPIGEGFGVFLLKNMKHAIRDKDRILAVIKAVVPAERGRTLDEACKAVNIDPGSVDIRQVSQLSPDRYDNDGNGDSLSVYMGEAAGMEALAKVLLGSGKIAALEVYNGEKKCMTVFIEKTGSYQESRRELQMPLEIHFQKQSLTYQKKPNVYEIDDEKQDSPLHLNEETGSYETTVFIAWQQCIEAIVKCAFDTRRKALRLLEQGQKACLPEQGQKVCLSAQREEACLMEQGQEACLAEQGQDAREPGPVRRKPVNQVIDTITFSNGQYHARLLVNEEHTFFFDHPLDHVPGILIMEGIFQLADAVFAGKGYSASGAAYYIRSLEIKFVKFCEKDQPATVRLRAEPPGTQEGFDLFAEVEQNGLTVCTAIMKAAPAEYPAKSASNPKAENYEITKPELTHKSNIFNVMVTPIEPMDGGKYGCRVMPPESGHACMDGDERFYSPLFLLEVTRQFAIQLTHLVHGIPFGTPINLISFEMSLDRPALRKSNIRMEYEKTPQVHVGNSTVLRMSIKVLDQDGIIGECSICGQAVDQETYRRQRFAGKT